MTTIIRLPLQTRVRTPTDLGDPSTIRVDAIFRPHQLDRLVLQRDGRGCPSSEQVCSGFGDHPFRSADRGVKCFGGWKE